MYEQLRGKRQMGGTQRQRLAGPEYHREGMADGVEDTSRVCTLKQGGSGLVSGKEGWEPKKGSGLKSTRALAQELCFPVLEDPSPSLDSMVHTHGWRHYIKI